ncbi:MAG TPA: deoxynucleoside kinase [Chitinophagales bacterium]|nr:deoxynucleoside kinase [Chitinophagales bacterium]HMW11971.1 deoxynucleoside kinase [Chitinophagales bacterium]HMX60831.1 deoxynucleoside kinase [Chitinophagales bacterium]HMY24286.1 deoxynucleoside kinase [Chitinophagales bacterium]HMZ33165.1 deoxynucleoside kinase [Chitinophagales bacterium]
MIYKFISIEGNIGAGKTTLASLLAEEFHGQLILEAFEDNPYLPKFYEDNNKYALQLEMSFLIERYQQLTRMFSEPNIFSNFTVTDYMLKKCLLFAKVNLSKQEYKLYKIFFDQVYKKLPKPEIIFYLHADTDQLMRNIRKRGREYEQNMSRIYLNRLEKMYFEFFKQNPENKYVIIDVNGIDWISNVFAYRQLLKLFDREYAVGLNFVKLEQEALLHVDASV